MNLPYLPFLPGRLNLLPPDPPPLPLSQFDLAKLEVLSPETLRAEAERWDRLAKAAEKEGDRWDAADCRAQAAHRRRVARRKEIRS